MREILQLERSSEKRAKVFSLHPGGNYFARPSAMYRKGSATVIPMWQRKKQTYRLKVLCRSEDQIGLSQEIVGTILNIAG